MVDSTASANASAPIILSPPPTPVEHAHQIPQHVLINSHGSDLSHHHDPLDHTGPPHNKHAVLVLYLVLITLVGAQVLLVWWKKKNKRSYEMVTLLGLWLIPPIVSFHLKFWRFNVVWTVFTCATFNLLYMCMKKGTLDPTTPRRVFSWFLIVHHACIGIGATGYVLFILEVFGLARVIWMIFGKGTSFTLLWYGLYFGILGRDAAEVVSDRLAARMSFGRKLAINPNMCGLCQKELNDFSHVGGPQPTEPSVQLACKHIFHEHCVKGWTMVGKKDVCPVCMEKVDLTALYADRPWETRNLQWINMLDAVRYLVVWNPVIVVALHYAMHFMGLEDDKSDVPPPPTIVSVAD